MRITEILAPAGNYDALVAAVNGGANAVYLGFGNLNARRNAIGFDDESLKNAIRYCKARNVKVYITLNTAIFDRELAEAAEDITKCARLGVDALIVEDMAIVALVKKIAPSIHLHASTQMAVHNVSGAKLMKELGFTRVVLAREMSKEEIKQINDNVDIETEVFVHGALCYCVSGQCYISSIIGERSGNRGLCAQSCRLPFEIPGTDVKNALSLKDLSLIEHLKEMEQIGVTSFKIEGRMKRPEYVYMATKQAGNSLDEQEVDYEGLRSVFSRSGFTTGYYHNKINADMFGIRQKEDVTDAAKVLKTLQNQLTKENPCIDIDYKFTLLKGKPSILTVTDGKNTATVSGEMPEIAQNKPTDEDMVKKSLLKTGGTYFNVRNIEINLDDGICLPVSKINELRRNAFEMIIEKREQVVSRSINQCEISQPKNTSISSIPLFRAEFFNASQIPQEDICLFERIYLPINEIKKALDIFGDSIKEKLWVVMPRVCFGNDKQKLEKDLLDIKNLGIKGVKSLNVGLLYLAKSLGFIVCGGFGLNITNSISLEEYKNIGLTDAVLSFELNLKDAKSINKTIPCGIIAYGYLPVMVTRNCPIRAFKGCKNCDDKHRYIIDRKNEKLSIKCSKTYSEILNPTEMYLGDRQRELMGFDFLEFLFGLETKEECHKILSDFKLGNKRENITRGLYYRNVL